MTRRAALAIAGLAVAGCLTGPPRATPAADFTSYLAGYGETFTTAAPPADAADWRPAVATFTGPGTRPASVVYGVVTCVNPGIRLRGTCGLTGPGRPRAIWYVRIDAPPDAPPCPGWATIDATTGEFISGLTDC